MQNQLSLEENNSCADFRSANTRDKRIEAAVLFCAERHRVYLAKKSGAPRPWTLDPSLRSYRFCNIYRELDKVTESVMKDWIRPQLDDPHIAGLAVLGRFINHPPTLALLREGGFNLGAKNCSDRAFSVLTEIQDSGTKLVTGAYIVNTLFPRDFPQETGRKSEFLSRILVPQLVLHGDAMRAAMSSRSFSATINSMRLVHGVGAFIGNQAAVDLSYTRLLSRSRDIDTTWNPGPGTVKGIRWIEDDETLRPGPRMEEALTAYLSDMNAAIARHPMYSANKRDMRSHLVPLSGPNASNSLCELSKIVWLATGRRDRLKNRYAGD